MIKVKTGNLLESGAQTLVNTVNCVGVMGKGIALEFKKRFPEMYQDYVRRCDTGQVKLGEPYLFKSMFDPQIVNFPTKDHWRSLARLSDIIEGLDYLEDHYKEWGITSIAVPPLGCGNGQLEWNVVGRTLYRRLRTFDIPVELYAPIGTPSSELAPGFLAGESSKAETDSWFKPEWLAVLEIVKRVGERPLHPPIGRVMFQKILFVATLLGIPTDLKFTRGSYGPYAAGEKRIESRLVNNGLLNVQVSGKLHEFSIGRTYTDARRSYGEVIDQWNDEIERAVNLFARIRSANDAEVIASILFSAEGLRSEGTHPTELDVFHDVLEWKQRRRPPLDPVDVAEAIRILASQGWMKVQYSHDLPIDDWALAI
jgi:O-acetyl-ADP-ribose deacetylase (regulator of RNase III)/uncharacterized protein YwgA